MTADTVKAWAETVHIPTYKIGQPDKNPMFLEKRVYQGSSGVVYPHPVIDRVFDEKEDKAYTALFLENRYLKIMILPEIGGRVQMALDKTNGYHFVYYNRVIKPALVGLAGPWISGGIEFNWPQHHRPSTFEPVDWRIEEHTDGSKTVWCSEIERMFRTKGMHGFRLCPDRAYLEIDVQLYNRTALPQTFLWWANPAVHVNDNYQSVFPPDVHAVMDHGKRDVSDFPIATGTYYKVNYAPGTDISRYKNIPVPTSYMAYHSDFDFVGCYDHGLQAGMMHVANHHVVPGKKQWTWGNGDFGQAWDRQLTDEDGPYIELMCGAYTDNQPDFSWLQPGEEKRFTQIFMPYKLIGPAKNASADAIINLEIADGQARIGVYVTQPREARVQLLHEGHALFDRTAMLDPENVLQETIAVPAAARPQSFTLRVLNGERELIAFTPLPDEKPEIPAPATAAKPPAEIESNEELFLNGLHLEQYRHATCMPEPYYAEALRRDPLDSRCNNAMGLLLQQRGKFAEAEPYFRTAIKRLTLRNPNPYDGEPFYNLGLALTMQGRYDAAFDAFYKAVWNAAWQDSGYFELARLASRAGRFDEALDLVEQVLRRNWSHHKARHLQIALLRQQGQADAARNMIAQALDLDPLEFGALWERRLLDGDDEFVRLARDNANTYIEIALDYAHAGLFVDAIELLNAAPPSDPMALYFAGWCYMEAGDEHAAREAFHKAAALPTDYCFPNKLECVPALQTAMRLNPNDARAPYYLGLFWYAHRRHHDAIAMWEQARALDERFPTVHRNLGLAYYNVLHDSERAWQEYQIAFELDPTDARVFFELDQLAKKRNEPPQARLERLEAHVDLVAQRDDLMIERIGLLNSLGRPEEAYALLMNRRFHPWEGGEGKVTGQYVRSLIEQARQQIARGAYDDAIANLQRAQTYPHNLGEGKLPGAQENHIFYYLGCAYEAKGDMEEARANFERAATGLSEPTSAVYYNDQPPDMIFYQGLARRKLGREAEARQIFQKLIDYGMAHLNDSVVMDYFAVSLPDFLVFDEDLNRRNQIHCHYMLALGYLGLGDQAHADEHFDQVLALNADHQGALVHRRMETQMSINLAGAWSLRLDRDDVGVQERWFNQALPDALQLPGSLQAQGYGDDVGLDTPWVGSMFDRSWFTDPRMEPYRQPGNIKVPFWLQPEKYYRGVAWYQRSVTIPPEWADQRVTLMIERTHWETQAWLDDRELGERDSLSTPHVYELGTNLAPGEHRLTIRVSNRIDLNVGPNAHSISDHTQTNWNGIIGRIELAAGSPIWIDDMQVYPHIASKSVTVRMRIGNALGASGRGRLTLTAEAYNTERQHAPAPLTFEIDLSTRTTIATEFQLGDDALLWDEFNPALYRMTARLEGQVDDTPIADERATTFGMREVGVSGTRLTINDRPIFLRGTLECCVFPFTGYPPTDAEPWKRIIRICQAHGLNHMRFHSWCPPEAAFVAADELGFYFQIECASWANQGASIGEGGPLDEWLYEEGRRITTAFGNHPSFIMMAYGNEPAGKFEEYLSTWVNYWKQRDPRRAHTSGAGWPALLENHYHNIPGPRIQQWQEGLNSRINAQPPETRTDYADWVARLQKPIVSHEIGQWCVYPNFDEIEKYRGFLKAKNYEIFRDLLHANHMGAQAGDFFMASGKLQALCYKEEIESALRTPGFGGFQLLSLNDFPGQGTALVGVVDAFWDAKGYVTPGEWARFCNATVPLARMDKRYWRTGETFSADIDVAHFGPAPIEQAVISWKLLDQSGATVKDGSLPSTMIAPGNVTRVGAVDVVLHDLAPAQKYTFVVAIENTPYENDWDIWVFADQVDTTAPDDIMIAETLDEAARARLEQGGTVLLMPQPETVVTESQIGFSSVFWNTSWTNNQPPHTLGILCDPQHPVFAAFPTEYHSNWQWWELIHGAAAMQLDHMPPDVRPLVQPIDTWFENRRLGLLFEARVGNGKLVVCSMDLESDLDRRIVARQFRHSLLRYMSSADFHPQIGVSSEAVAALTQAGDDAVA